MIDDEISSTQQRNEKLHANIAKLMKENNAVDFGFLNENNKYESSLKRHKSEFQSKLKSIDKMEAPSKVELKQAKEDTERNKRVNPLSKETSPKKELIEENKRLRTEIEKLNKSIDSLKVSLRAKDEGIKDLIEDFKDKEKRIFKDHDFNLARLKREYDQKIQLLQSKVDEKNENEVRLTHKYDRLREESLIKDSIIKKLNEQIVQKENDYTELMKEMTLKNQPLAEEPQAGNSDEGEEELYCEKNEEGEYLNMKSRFDALEKNLESRIKQDISRVEGELFNDTEYSKFKQSRPTKFAPMRPILMSDGA